MIDENYDIGYEDLTLARELYNELAFGGMKPPLLDLEQFELDKSDLQWGDSDDFEDNFNVQDYPY